jgi:Ca2+-transporting ATPase
MADGEWHSETARDIFEQLATSPQGLSGEEPERRLDKYGFNELREREKTSALKILLQQFKDIFVIILLIAIAFTVVTGYYEALMDPSPHGFLGDYVDAIVISVIVMLNAVIGFVQEYRSEKAMEAMSRLTAPTAKVVRDGRVVEIAARELVPGDVIVLEEGDRVPADGRLVETIELKTDEAVLTGESTPVAKTVKVLKTDLPIADRTNMVFQATHTVLGRGKAVVTATGMSTEFGKIAELVQAAPEEAAPLSVKLEGFAKRLAILIVAICAVIFLIEGFENQWRYAALLEAFTTAVALAVSAVPEGLPAIVTVTLALGARELAKRNSLIRKLASVETLGSTTVICSDKTGTLTKGEMTVRKLWLNGSTLDVTGTGYEPKGIIKADEEVTSLDALPDLALLLRIGALCNNARLDHEEGAWRILGDPTEGALLVVAAKAGYDATTLASEHPRLGEIPFSSERKRMTTIHAEPEGSTIAYVKGAVEVVLDRCTTILTDGRIAKLTDEERYQILWANETLATDALRILGMAYRELPAEQGAPDEEVENELVFVGMTGMIDPPRDEVFEANRLCTRAGIKTVMITGDHKVTATAIAREIALLREGDLAITGAELGNLSDKDFADIVERVSVYARVSPEHKLRIVKALKAKGHIVAMTGDGVNDAPAIKTADIGIAMGITGTDVTKEASDMILADDNFATIVNAVEGGRVIYDNIRKFLRYLLSSNFDELLVIASFALLGLPLPLLPAMILWINLVTDGGPALAMSADPPVDDVMNRPPRDPKEGVMHGMLAFILMYVALQSGTTILSFSLKYFIQGSSLAEARTLAFVQACFFELIVVWNCRSERHNVFKTGIFSNKYLLVAVATGMLLTVSLCYIPVFQLMFGTVPLVPMDWLWALFTAFLGLLVLPEVFMGRRIPFLGS